MPPVGDFRFSLLRQAQIELVHETSGLECVILRFPTQVSMRDAAQIVIRRRRYAGKRLMIALIPALEQDRDFTRSRLLGHLKTS